MLRYKGYIDPAISRQRLHRIQNLLHPRFANYFPKEQLKPLIMKECQHALQFAPGRDLSRNEKFIMHPSMRALQIKGELE